MKLETIIKRYPNNMQGCISATESKFLYNQIIKYNVENCLEIGVASGCSSAVLIGALVQNKIKKRVTNYVLYSYDLLDYCYFDKSLNVGYATKPMLGGLESYNWVLRTKATCLDLKKNHPENFFDLIFIDANHFHPWPSVDMYGCLPYVKNGGIICLHDINLPKKNPKFQHKGAQVLYHDLDCQKYCINEKIPNIGVLIIDNNKNYLRSQLRQIIKKYKWGVKVGDNFIEDLNINL